jgi:hypothetical protein
MVIGRSIHRAVEVSWLASVVLGLVGCGPSVASLVRDHHYREAVCAVAGGDEAEVMDALVRDANVRVRAHRLDAEELTVIDARAVEALGPRAAVVVVALDGHRMPVDALTAEVTVLEEGEPASVPVTRSALIWATDETEPAPEVRETGVTPANAFLGIAYAMTGGLPLLFGSLAAMSSGRAFSPFPDRALVSVPASDREYERLAPVAIALERALPVCRSPLGAALRCEGALLTDPRLSNASLRITIRAMAQRVSRRGEPLEESCVATREYTLPWPSLDDDIADVVRDEFALP